jgi:hypothetical protein
MRCINCYSKAHEVTRGSFVKLPVCICGKCFMKSRYQCGECVGKMCTYKGCYTNLSKRYRFRRWIRGKLHMKIPTLCNKHTCKKRGCNRHVAYINEQYQVKLKKRYCDSHGCYTCGKKFKSSYSMKQRDKYTRNKSCPNCACMFGRETKDDPILCTLAAKSINYLYCSLHNCNFGISTCTNGSFDKSNIFLDHPYYCEKHLCPIMDCAMPSYGEHIRYCLVHYCVIHKCSKKQCTKIMKKSLCNPRSCNIFNNLVFISDCSYISHRGTISDCYVHSLCCKCYKKKPSVHAHIRICYSCCHDCSRVLPNSHGKDVKLTNIEKFMLRRGKRPVLQFCRIHNIGKPFEHLIYMENVCDEIEYSHNFGIKYFALNSRYPDGTFIYINGPWALSTSRYILYPYILSNCRNIYMIALALLLHI